NDQAFYLCARHVFRGVLAAAAPVRLEPWMRVEVTAPAVHHGAVLASLMARHGRVVDAVVGPVDGRIVAEVPLRPMLGYATVLRSVTSGTGEFSMELVRYAPV